MSSPEETTKTPQKKPRQGVPLERVIIALSLVGIAALLFFGISTLAPRVKLSTVPVAGAWQALRQPWRMEFKPDNTILSYNGSSQADVSNPGTAGKGTYKVDYFGTLWVTLDNGKVFQSTLNPEMPNRFDLIQVDTQSVTVFNRVTPMPMPSAPQTPQ